MYPVLVLPSSIKSAIKERAKRTINDANLMHSFFVARSLFVLHCKSKVRVFSEETRVIRNNDCGDSLLSITLMPNANAGADRKAGGSSNFLLNLKLNNLATGALRLYSNS